MHQAPNRYITLNQFIAMLLGRSQSSDCRDPEHGRIPTPIQVGARLYWCEEEVHEFLLARRLDRTS